MRYRGDKGNPPADAPQQGKSAQAGDPEQAQRDANFWNITTPPKRFTGPPADLIEAEGHPAFTGRWIAQYFDRPAGVRYSLGITPDKRFFVLCLDNLTHAAIWKWFENANELRRGELPERLKNPPAEQDRLGQWPRELDP